MFWPKRKNNISFLTACKADQTTSRINAQIEKLRQALATDVSAFNKMAREKEAPAVFVKPAADAAQTLAGFRALPDGAHAAEDDYRGSPG